MYIPQVLKSKLKYYFVPKSFFYLNVDYHSEVFNFGFIF